MEKIQISCLVRQTQGKKGAKKTRNDGFTPAVVYGKGLNRPIMVPFPSLKTLRSIHFSESTIIEMSIEGEKGNPFSVLIKDIQYNPLTEEPLHIDFLKVSLKEKIKVRVPLKLVGECQGVKDGGILEQMLWDVAIEALPLDIPENITIDISNLEIAHSLHVSDLVVSPNVKLIEPPEETIATVVVKREEEEEVPAEVAEEAAEEPEVIKEKEKEEKEVKEEKEEKKEKKE